eukprot:1852443-Rhodomonas_salina.1
MTALAALEASDMTFEVSASSQGQPAKRPRQEVSAGALLNCGSSAQDQLSGNILSASKMITFANMEASDMISEVSASSQDKPTQRPTQDVSDAVLLNCGSYQISGASLFNSNVV